MDRTVHLLFFATAREAIGRPRLERPVGSEGIAVADLVDALAREYPRLAPVLRTSRLVLNGRYLRGTGGRVGPGDELAVHPPYSGG